MIQSDTATHRRPAATSRCGAASPPVNDPAPPGMPLLQLRRCMRAANLYDIWLGAMDAMDAEQRRRLFAGALQPRDLVTLARHGDCSGGRRSSKLRLRSLLRQAQSGGIDVIVVGAGAAGLAAAAALHEAGKRVLVLERDARTGGRARTETRSFGRAIDLGAEHLHSAATNPAAALARQLGFTLRPHAPEPGLAFGGCAEQSPQSQAAALLRSRLDLCDAIDRAQNAQDVSCQALLPPDDQTDDWRPSAQAQLFELEMGIDAATLSSLDLQTIMPEREGDMYVAEGLGTLVQTLSLGLPVACHAEVHHVAYGAHGCQVYVGKTCYLAAHVIVTAPVGLLQRGSITFAPPLPAPTQDALHALVMAQYEKAVLRFRHDVFNGLPSGTYMQWRCTPQTAMDFFLQPPMQKHAPAGACIAVVYFGGAFAQTMRRAPALAVATALHRLSDAFGSHIETAFCGAMMTQWEVVAGGAYSAARAGHHAARQVLAQPVAQRLLFAGEACDAPLADGHSWCTQLPGALRSGAHAATMVLCSPHKVYKTIASSKP